MVQTLIVFQWKRTFFISLCVNLIYSQWIDEEHQRIYMTTLLPQFLEGWKSRWQQVQQTPHSFKALLEMEATIVFFPLFVRGFTTAVTQYNKFSYLFDSHERDIQRLSIADRTSPLLKLAILEEVDSYIQVVNSKYVDIQQSYF